MKFAILEDGKVREVVECANPRTHPQAAHFRAIPQDSDRGWIGVKAEDLPNVPWPDAPRAAPEKAVERDSRIYTEAKTVTLPRSNPFDHDGDGRPGGSLPKGRRR